MNLLKKILHFLLLVPITLSICDCNIHHEFVWEPRRFSYRIGPTRALDQEIKCIDVTLDGKTTIKDYLKEINPQIDSFSSHIIIMNSTMPVVDRAIFGSLSFTAKLTLDNDGIIDIQPYSFSSLFALSTLIITNNPLTSIRDDALSEMKILKILNLSHNKLATLDNINQISSIANLNVSHNQIKKINYTDLQKMEQLTTLDLSGNLLSKVDSEIFKNLQHLYLQDNFIHSFTIIKHNQPIAALNLSNNYLKTIDIDESEPIIIYSLDLSNNFINVLKEDQFQNLHKLSVLLLDSSQIQEINLGAFSNLKNLSKLSLSKNEITTLYAGTFYTLNTLEYLDLSWNQIETMHSGIFTGLNSLTYLDLSENKLHSINQHIYYPLKNVETLYLHGNQLDYMQTYSLTSRLKSLKHISINFKKVGCVYVGSLIDRLKDRDIKVLRGQHIKNHNVHGIGCDPEIKDINRHWSSSDLEEQVYTILGYFSVIQGFMIALIIVAIIFLIIKSLAFCNIDFDYCKNKFYDKDVSTDARFSLSENDHD